MASVYGEKANNPNCNPESLECQTDVRLMSCLFPNEIFGTDLGNLVVMESTGWEAEWDTSEKVNKSKARKTERKTAVMDTLELTVDLCSKENKKFKDFLIKNYFMKSARQRKQLLESFKVVDIQSLNGEQIMIEHYASLNISGLNKFTEDEDTQDVTITAVAKDDPIVKGFYFGEDTTLKGTLVDNAKIVDFKLTQDDDCVVYPFTVQLWGKLDFDRSACDYNSYDENTIQPLRNSLGNIIELEVTALNTLVTATEAYVLPAGATLVSMYAVADVSKPTDGWEHFEAIAKL